MQDQDIRLKNPFRDYSKFASDFTRWAYSACAKTLYLTDNDGVFYKRSNKILLIVEFKWWLEPLTNSQKCILPIQQRQIDSDITSGLLHIYSGAFVIRGDVRRKFQSATIVWRGTKTIFPAGAKIQQPWKRRECSVDIDILTRFLSCEPLELPWKTRYE
jgi:hypothetical protein